jgi:hypothetical protein
MKQMLFFDFALENLFFFLLFYTHCIRYLPSKEKNMHVELTFFCNTFSSPAEILLFTIGIIDYS